MIPSQLLRTLDPACRSAGVPHDPAAVPDDATHDDALDLLARLAEAVEADRPTTEPRRPSLRVRRVLELARAGRRDTEIAAELGTTADAVRSTRRRHRVEGQGTYVPEGSGWEERTRELHARGLTTAQIAEETGWSIRTVQQRLWRCGLRAHRAPKAG